MLALFKITFSVLMCWLIFKKLDLEVVVRTLQYTSLNTVLISLSIFFITHIVSAFRWYYIVQSCIGKVPKLLIIKGILLERFMSGTLPFIAADATRVLLLIRVGILKKFAIYSVILDRIYALMGAVLLALLLSPFSLHNISSAILQYSVLFMLLTAVFCFISLSTFKASWWQEFLKWEKLRYLLDLIVFSGIYSKTLYSFWSITLSLFIQLLMSLVYIILAKNLSIDVSITEMIAFAPIVFILSLIPISVAGWGIREGVIVTFLSYLGADKSAALTLSILYGLLLLISSMFCGLVWLFIDNKYLQNESMSR